MIRFSGCLFLWEGVDLIGNVSLYDGGVTNGQAGYLDSRSSPLSAGVPLGLAEFGNGTLHSPAGISRCCSWSWLINAIS